MPDLDQLDPRLDAAFEHIARDVSGRSTPLGARAAIRTSRRRRGALAGSVAVLALVAGGVAAGQFLPGDQGAGIAERGDGLVSDARPLPDPAPFTAEAFSEATDGWAGPWDEFQAGFGAADSCFWNESEASEGESLDPSRVATYPLGPQTTSRMPRDRDGMSTTAAYAAFAEYDHESTARTAYQSFGEVFAACEASDETQYTLVYDDADGKGEATAAVALNEDTVELNVVARRADGLTFLSATASGGTGLPTEEVIGRVTDTLVAGLQSEGTFAGRKMMSDSAVEESDNAAEGPDGESATAPSDAEFAAIVDGWATHWELGGTLQSIQEPPCADAELWQSDAEEGTGGSFGSTGEYSHGRWTSATEAEDRWGVLNESLEHCEKARWQVTPIVSHAPKVAVSVASLWATYDGGTVFAVHQGRDIAVLHLDGDAHPPAEVAEDVLTFLAADLLSRSLPPSETTTARP